MQKIHCDDLVEFSSNGVEITGKVISVISFGEKVYSIEVLSGKQKHVFKPTSVKNIKVIQNAR